MPETDLTWGGSNRFGSITLEETRLRAEGIPVYPQLVVPVGIKVASSWIGSDRDLKLWSVSSALYLNDSLISDHPGEIFDSTCHPSPSSNEFRLRFALDRSRIQHIERTRTGDAPFAIRGTLVFESTLKTAPKTVPTTQRPSPALSDAPIGQVGVPFRLDFRVPRSHWATTILPALGWSATHIVELPSPSTLEWKDAFATSHAELAEAERLFNEGNYDQTVAHCRAAIEPFRKKSQDLKPLMKESRAGPGVSEKEFAFLNAMATDTANWLDGQLNRFHTLASVAHHVPAIGHFSRAQAHALLLQATSLVLYAGSAVAASKPKGEK